MREKIEVSDVGGTNLSARGAAVKKKIHFSHLTPLTHSNSSEV
jgi:hypothetical protein